MLTSPDANAAAPDAARRDDHRTPPSAASPCSACSPRILQLTAISQVSVFGVPADLSPLIVASVGFLTGSVPGALFGFAFGLFVDTALMQTLGVTSLVLTAVGYGAGRLRELRDPAHGLAPVAVGAAATARRRARLTRCCSSCWASRRPSRCRSLRQS